MSTFTKKWFSNLSGLLTFTYLKQCFCQQMHPESYKIIENHRNIWQFQKQPDTDYIFLLVLWSHPVPHWWGRGRRSQRLSWELSLSLSCWTCPCSTPSWKILQVIYWENIILERHTHSHQQNGKRKWFLWRAMSTFLWILTSALNLYTPERIYCLEGWVGS